MVSAGIAFFSIIAYLSFSKFADYPWLFGILILVSIISVLLILAVGLGVLGTPKQGEPTAVSLLTIQKFGVIVATGFPSPEGLVAAVRELSGMKKLPAPAAIVGGKASDKKAWRALSSDEAEKVATEDNAAVDERLQELALSAIEQIVKPAVTGQAVPLLDSSQGKIDKETSEVDGE